MPLSTMNLTTSSTLPADILYANFNQDSSSISVGCRSGYRLFNLSSVDKLEQIHESTDETADVCLVERLFLSSLVAQVSLSSPRKLKVCHFRKGVEICDYSYSNTILCVKMNRIRLLVVLEDCLYIHDISDMRLLHTINDTPANTHGVCDLAANNDNSLLAYPGSSNSGEVQIFDVANLKAVATIQAHTSGIAAMKFNRDASLLATASDKGTIIRVFAVPSGQRLFEFRRGMKRYANIGSIAFSQDSRFLAVSSNTETVHIFKLDAREENQPPEDNNNNTNDSWMQYMNKMWKTSSNYIPSQVTNMIYQDRAFATVKLPFSGLKNVCTLTVIKQLLRVVIASEDGYLYIYNLDQELGGQCDFVRQHRLDSHGPISIKPNPNSTYAAATKGDTKYNNNTQKIRSGSVEICSSSSSAEFVEKESKTPPKGKLKNLVDEHELVEDLPLDDDHEFPPMSLYAD